MHPYQTEVDGSDLSQANGYGRLRTSYLGLPSSLSPASPVITGTQNLLWARDSEVVLIDELRIQGHTNDAATNLTVTLKINDQLLPFHLSGTANERVHKTLVWKPKGALILHPGKVLQAYASASNLAYVSGRYRIMGTQKAAELGYLTGGTLPNVASTNTLSADPVSEDPYSAGTTADTAKAIIPPLANHYVEILGFTCTGHNFNSALDSSLLSFWDGTTGSFGTDDLKIFRAYHRGVNGIYQSNIMVGNTRGCIQGPVGYGVYISQTTNVAGSTPKADFNVIYRYRKNTECIANTGTEMTTGGKKWWRYHEGLTLGTSRTFFDISTAPACTVKILGHAGTLTGTDQAANGGVGIGIGADATQLITEFYAVNGDGNTGATARSWAVDDDTYFCSLQNDPAFVGADAASAITARSQLAWGTLEAGVRPLTTRANQGSTVRETWTA